MLKRAVAINRTANMFYLNPGVVLRIVFRDIQLYNIMMLLPTSTDKRSRSQRKSGIGDRPKSLRLRGSLVGEDISKQGIDGGIVQNHVLALGHDRNARIQ
jgi:hypothetical protein